jgi:hypothetical protein
MKKDQVSQIVVPPRAGGKLSIIYSTDRRTMSQMKTAAGGHGCGTDNIRRLVAAWAERPAPFFRLLRACALVCLAAAIATMQPIHLAGCRFCPTFADFG